MILRKGGEEYTEVKGMKCRENGTSWGGSRRSRGSRGCYCTSQPANKEQEVVLRFRLYIQRLPAAALEAHIGVDVESRDQVSDRGHLARLVTLRIFLLDQLSTSPFPLEVNCPMRASAIKRLL